METFNPNQTPQEHVDADFEALMNANFENHIGAPAVESHVQLTDAEIDAEVAKFSAELNTAEGAGLSAADQEFLAENGMTWREMTAEELAVVAANEQRAREAVAAEQSAHDFFTLMNQQPITGKKKKTDA